MARGKPENGIKLGVPDRPGARGSLLRFREVKGAAKPTCKGPATLERHKSGEELELDAGNARILRSILERPGFRSIFR
jgi:hypothetical protein